MAVRCSASPTLMIQISVPIKKPANEVMMIQSQTAVRQTPPLQIRSSSRNKIFEDESSGIVCYRDDSGEITCEGYDEGPRLHQQITPVRHQSRDAEIVDLLEKNWQQIVKAGGFNCEGKGDAGLKGFNSNGFNTLC